MALVSADYRFFLAKLFGFCGDLKKTDG